MGEADSATEAFRRVLAQAGEGGHAKVDALVTLIQRTVFVPTWSPDGTDYRTLVNSEGEAALPIFTGRDILKEAAYRFGWTHPAAEHGTHQREVGAREALRFVITNKLAYAVLDVSAHHSLEVSLEEIAPLLTQSARRDSSGPYHASGKVSDSMLEAVRASKRPSSRRPYSEAPAPVSTISSAGRYGAAALLDEVVIPKQNPVSLSPPAQWVTSQPPLANSEAPEAIDAEEKRLIGSDPPPADESTRISDRPENHSLEAMALAALEFRESEKPQSATSLSSAPTSSPPINSRSLSSRPPSARPPSAPPVMPEIFAFDTNQPVDLGALTIEPTEDLLDALRAVLRDYPEVEWASLCHGKQSDKERTVAALRLIQGYRKNLSEIESGLRLAAEKMDVPLAVVILETPTQVRQSREHALPFFPWRSRKPSVRG